MIEQPSTAQLNTIKNALIESFGFEGHQDAFSRARSSRRFGVLVGLTYHSRSEHGWSRLVKAAALLADNPTTRAQMPR